MIYPHNTAQQISEKIKQTWNHLSDDEIATHDCMRDVFFMALRKKHGVARPIAEEILRDWASEANSERMFNA